jgi:hypothetical protein
LPVNVLSPDARREHDAPAAASSRHDLRGALGHVESAGEVRGDVTIPVGAIDFEEGGEPANACVGDADVKPANHIRGAVDQGAGGVVVADVGVDMANAAPGGSSESLGFLPGALDIIPVRQHDVRAGDRGRLGDREAYAARSARHHGAATG